MKDLTINLHDMARVEPKKDGEKREIKHVLTLGEQIGLIQRRLQNKKDRFLKSGNDEQGDEAEVASNQV